MPRRRRRRRTRKHVWAMSRRVGCRRARCRSLPVRPLLLELCVGLLESLAHRRPGLVGAASELQPGVARGRLHLAQLFPGLVLMLTDRGELLLVLRAHARLGFCGLAFPFRHLGAPLIELGLQLRDVFFTLGCHVASLIRNGRKFVPYYSAAVRS